MNDPYGAAATNNFAQDVQQPQFEEQPTTFFCRALYDYQSGDSSSLSFRKNEIIEVLTRLESGWWDGLLGDERGWFPSNYVEIITDQEAEVALAPPQFQAQPPPADDTVIDIAGSMASALSSSSNDDWLLSGSDYSHSLHRPNGHSLPNGSVGATQHNDFWVPKVSEDGRIFYLNEQTGQHSQDLPQESEDPEGDLLALAQSPSHPSQAMTPASAGSHAYDRSPQDNMSQAGFGLPRRATTPEPWTRRLADDGLSYYYQNRITGQVVWTLPEPDDPPAYTDDRPPIDYPQVVSYLPNDFSSGSHRLRSDSSVSRNRERSDSAVDRISIYSDDSGVQPRQRHRSESASSANNRHLNGVTRMEDVPQRSPERPSGSSLTPAEETARALQSSLTPPPPEVAMEMSLHVREAIASVVEFLQSTGSSREPEKCQEVDRRVRDVVATVRNLLYTTATPTGHIPVHLYSRNPLDSRSQGTQGLQTHLKASHRKVAGTLSKLVLSALAMQYDPQLTMVDKPNRMESDAMELERSVAAFVVEVQRFQEQHLPDRSPADSKRLYGVFSTRNVGQGLPGAGVAGSWKGFGYVPHDDTVQPPSRPLLVETIDDLKTSISAVEQKLISLLALAASSNAYLEGDRLHSDGQALASRLSAVLASISDLDVARHLDVDGARAETDDTQYMQIVEQARGLLRTLESTIQALYDDGSSLLSTLQAFRATEHFRDAPAVRYDTINSSVTSIRGNLKLVMSTLESMFYAGNSQAEIGQISYNSSIEWRKSRLSIITATMENVSHRRTESQEDVVDMELAFSRPGMRTVQSLETNGSSTLYRNHSETSLDNSDRSRSEGNAEPVTPTWPSHDPVGNGTVAQHSPSGSADDFTLDDQSSPLFDDDGEGGPSSSKSPPRAAKLIKLLGPDAPQHYLTTLSADQKPWYLRPNYDQNEILIDPDGSVRAGTTQALVERLTAHEHWDPKFIKNFLMTFKSFMTLDELFDLLVNRFCIKPPENLNEEELVEWTKLKQHVIRMRVLNTFKTLVTDDELLEKDDLYILDRLKTFVQDPEVSSFAAAKQLLILIERAQRGGDAPIKTTNTTSESPPAPIVPKSSKKLKLLDIDPTELARQLTLMESLLYKKIRPMECLHRSRESKAAGKPSDNITSIIQLSNRIANWVAETVLSREDSRKRAAIVKHFITVADRCRILQNFSSMVAIISGLNTPPIRRLKRTWEQVNGKFMQQLTQCESTIDTNKNFNNYRSLMQRIIPPCVPFIGVSLTTLTFINDGAEDKLAGQMINFRKRQKAADVIQEIKRWQSKPYSLQTVATVLSYLEEAFVKYVDGVDYGDQFWNLSLEREPREREDEKMARLLQESGFL